MSTLNPPPLDPAAAPGPERHSSRLGVVAAVLGGVGSAMVLVAAAWVASIWNDPDWATGGSVVSLVVAATAVFAFFPGLVAIVLSALALRRPGIDPAARWGFGLALFATAPAVLLVGLVLSS